MASDAKAGMRVLVTGGTGMVGSALHNLVQSWSGGHAWTFAGSGDGDLLSLEQTRALFAASRPNIVVHLAALVGGLLSNRERQADYCSDNARMALNVMQCCREFGVRKVVTCLSTCIFPDPPPAVPMTEEHVHAGEPCEFNAGYAYAKRFLDRLCRSYSRQYGIRCVSLVPCNLYGPRDNFDPHQSHVIPALLRKCFTAALGGEPYQPLGTGTPRRQFMYVYDFARVLRWAALQFDLEEEHPVLIVAPPEEHTIREASDAVRKAVGVRAGVLVPQPKWAEETADDGQPHKLAGGALLARLMPGNVLPGGKFTPLEDGMLRTAEWYADQL